MCVWMKNLVNYIFAFIVEQVRKSLWMTKQNSSRRWKVSELGKLELVSVTKLTWSSHAAKQGFLSESILPTYNKKKFLILQDNLTKVVNIFSW